MSLRNLIKLAALASTCWMSVGQALAENRIALVIGNSNYTSVTALPNPANDAKAMTNFLSSAGFQVVQAPDLTQSDMRRTIADFAKTVDVLVCPPFPYLIAVRDALKGSTVNIN